MKVKLMCKCGTVFYRVLSESHGKRYCSHSCRNKYRKLVFSDKRNIKLSKSKKGVKNSMWVGNNVCYAALHQWVKRNKPISTVCEECGIKIEDYLKKQSRMFDLANISGEYKRDINDFEWLCRRCHMKKDGRGVAAARCMRDAKVKKNNSELFKGANIDYRSFL